MEADILDKGSLGQQKSLLKSYEEVFFPTIGGLYNYGVFFKPEGEGPFPAVIVVHGGLGEGFQPREEAIISKPRVRDALLKEGYAVFIIDYRRHDFGGLEVDDVISAFEHLRSRSDVIADKIAFVGGSHGGYLVMRAVMRIRAAAAIVYAGLIDIEKIFLQKGSDISRRWAAQEIARELKERYGSNVEAYRNLSIHTHAAEIKSPILYVIGTEDPIFPQLPALRQAMEKAEKTLGVSIHPGMPHGFYWGKKREVTKEGPNREEEFQKSISKTIEFLKKHMGPGARVKG